MKTLRDIQTRHISYFQWLAFAVSQLQIGKYHDIYRTQMLVSSSFSSQASWRVFESRATGSGGRKAPKVGARFIPLSTEYNLGLQDNMTPGMSTWVLGLNDMNMMIASNMTGNKAILTEANHTVTSVMRTTKAQVCWTKFADLMRMSEVAVRFLFTWTISEQTEATYER